MSLRLVRLRGGEAGAKTSGGLEFFGVGRRSLVGYSFALGEFRKYPLQVINLSRRWLNKMALHSYCLTCPNAFRLFRAESPAAFTILGEQQNTMVLGYANVCSLCNTAPRQTHRLDRYCIKVVLQGQPALNLTPRDFSRLHAGDGQDGGCHRVMPAFRHRGHPVLCGRFHGRVAMWMPDKLPLRSCVLFSADRILLVTVCLALGS